MLTLMNALAAVLVMLWPTIAVAFEATGTLDLTGQIELLRVAETSSRATARTIEALDTAIFELSADDLDAVERLHEEARAARRAAEAAVEHAGAQLEFARMTVEHLLDQIKIEGAETVDVGGEVRAARMLVLGWHRLIETDTASLAQLRNEIARMDALRCEGCRPEAVATQSDK